MKFSENEIRYLMAPHPVEHATSGPRTLVKMVDWRELGCPTDFFERALEARAKKLGRKFVEFRDSQRPAGTAPAQPDLVGQIEAARLF